MDRCSLSHPCPWTTRQRCASLQHSHQSSVALKWPWRTTRCGEATVQSLYELSLWLRWVRDLIITSHGDPLAVSHSRSRHESAGEPLAAPRAEWEICARPLGAAPAPSIGHAGRIERSQAESAVLFERNRQGQHSHITSLFDSRTPSQLTGRRNWQANPSAVLNSLAILGPALADCLKDGNTPVRLAAERCALHAFQLTKGTTKLSHIDGYFPFTVLLILGPPLFLEKPRWATGAIRVLTPPLIHVAGAERIQAAQKYITGLDARRLSKLPENRYRCRFTALNYTSQRGGK